MAKQALKEFAYNEENKWVFLKCLRNLVTHIGFTSRGKAERDLMERERVTLTGYIIKGKFQVERANGETTLVKIQDVLL